MDFQMTDDRHFGKKFQTLCTPLMAANTVVLKTPEWFWYYERKGFFFWRAPFKVSNWEKSQWFLGQGKVVNLLYYQHFFDSGQSRILSYYTDMVGVTKCNLQKNVICRYKDVLIYFQGEQHNHDPQPSPCSLCISSQTCVLLQECCKLTAHCWSVSWHTLVVVYFNFL